MRYRRQGFKTEHKDDNSPVTKADRAADQFICTALGKIANDIPIISEEGTQDAAAANAPFFWCVDPLDGTKAFVAGSDEFTVNIALIADHQPVIGVIYVPAQGVLYYGSDGDGAYRKMQSSQREAITVREAKQGALCAVVSSYHGKKGTSKLADRYGVVETVAASSSLKFCLVAEGTADLYPRFGRTMEWDTAAGHAILHAAGGAVDVLEDRVPLRYGKAGYENPNFLAYGKVEI